MIIVGIITSIAYFETSTTTMASVSYTHLDVYKRQRLETHCGGPVSNGSKSKITKGFQCFITPYPQQNYILWLQTK